MLCPTASSANSIEVVVQVLPCGVAPAPSTSSVQKVACLPHAVRKAHSCKSQLVITMDDILSSYDSSQCRQTLASPTHHCILDISHAFDTAPHGHLMGKLAHYVNSSQQWPINTSGSIFFNELNNIYVWS